MEAKNAMVEHIMKKTLNLFFLNIDFKKIKNNVGSWKKIYKKKINTCTK